MMIARLKKFGFLFFVVGVISCDSAGSQAPPPAGAGGAAAEDAGDASRGGGGGKDGGSHIDAPADASADATADSNPPPKCKIDSDCKAPETMPAACAVAKCDLTQHACVYLAKDGDGDGHATNNCKASDGTPIVLGDDCDDTNPMIFPGAWDGPSGDGHPDRCDGIDQDCNSILDDGRLLSGATCSCAPNDVRKCSQDAGGQPITFPGFDGNGNPLGKYCKLGKETCTANGQWGPCIGAVGPLPADLCDGLDENCNGKVDMADSVPPVGQLTYTFDGDLDNHAASGTADAKQSGCPGQPPSTCPAYFKGTCKASMQWRTGTFPLDDCDDNNPNAYPGAQEKCNNVDDDCNGIPDDNAVDAKSWVFDWDGDGYGDINVKAVKACNRPTTVPDACTQGLKSVPSSYCAGSTIEGNTPACPPPACAATMWVVGVTATDCKDNPGEGDATLGNKPELVHPGGTDLCNGKDYACQGTPDIGCGCAPVGSTKTCGDTQTCNGGKATCNQGGTWGACDGGDPKQRLDYCMDFDSDGFCDLSNCKAMACPADVPASAGWKQKSLCNPVADCNDKAADIFPASIETCNGDGKDYNCNSIPNTPGAGDCDCISTGTNKQTMVDCKPQVGYYPPAAKPGDPSKGTPGYVQGSPLQGVCKWGTAVCNPTGRLGACTGANPGQSPELCNGDGKDYDCNGVVNTTMPGDCGCTNGEHQLCGTCSLGMQSCENGQWGTCLGDPGYQTYCPDNDLDGYCVLTSCNVSACPNDPRVTQQKLKPQGGCQVKPDCDDARAGTHPGAPEYCNDNLDSDCDGNINNGYPIGGSCTVGDHGVCRRKSTLVCNGAGTGTQCGVSAGSPTDSFQTSPSTDPFIDTSNTSVDYFPRWDWNCDGQNETLFALNHNATIRGEVCSGNFEAGCNQLPSPGSCGQIYVYCESTGGFFNTDPQSCGRPFIAVLCLWGANNDGQCGAVGNQNVASMDCK